MRHVITMTTSIVHNQHDVHINPEGEQIDHIQLLSYEKDFRIAFLESKGNAFQHLFEKIMSKVHRDDFITCRPWGKSGDKKNDGYLPSEKTIFQIYAPNELSANEAIKKIREDFDGAKKHWSVYFDKWIFVHNSQNGLGPQVIKVLQELQQENTNIKIGHWGYEEILEKFRQLNLQDLRSWFGPPLTMEANVNIGYEDLNAVLKHIDIVPATMASEINEVSKRKIEANLLSQAVADFLKIGMQKSPLVAQFFNDWRDPTYGEQVAQAFKNKYLSLRNERPRIHPDEIFARIEVWAGGTTNITPRHKAAVLAVMAYLFDKCEIFEDAKTLETV